MPFAKSFYEVKVPFKVKVFVWAVVLNRINANDMLKVCRHLEAVCSDMCLMCCQ